MSRVFSKIKQILHESYSIQLDQIQLETRFELELGTDSREFFELLSDFENAFDIEINFETVVDIVTVQDAVNYIENHFEVYE
jgi:acyl carrier protein